MNLLAVNFHYFREETYNSGIYPVSKAALTKQLDALAKEYSFISQEQILHKLKHKAKDEKNYCVITIDDGLKEQMHAFDYLQSLGIPSILYVPSYPIQNQQVLDVHKLHYVRTHMKDQELYDILNQQFNIDTFNFDEASLANQYRYDEPLSRKVKYFMNFVLTNQEKQEAIDVFFAQLISDETSFANKLYMNEADIKTLAQADALGSHGHRHMPLATLSKTEAKLDIDLSLEYLERIGEKPIRSFSYPYGGKDAVNESLINHFEGTQVEFAFTMWRGINTEATLLQPYLLQRIDTNDAPGGKNNSTEFSLATHA